MNAHDWPDGEYWGENCGSDGIEAKGATDSYNPESGARELGMLAYAKVQRVLGNVVVEATLIPTAYDDAAAEAYL